MDKILTVYFEKGEPLQIKLLNNELVDLWIDTHFKTKDIVNKNFLTRKAMLFFHGMFIENNNTENIKKMCIQKINDCILKIKKEFNLDFPYKAYEGMSWDQTNNIHRCFTTGLTSRKCWKYENVTKEQLIKYKTYYNPTIPDNKQSHEFFKSAPTSFFPPKHLTDYCKGDNGLYNWQKPWWLYGQNFNDRFISLTETINKYVHIYEDQSLSHIAKEEINKHNIQDLIYFETEWDTYNETGNKGYHTPRIPKFMNKYCDYDNNTIDVFITKSITGKDYFQCYQEYDNPLEWDIENFCFVNGGFTINPGKMLSKWFDLQDSINWLSKNNVPICSKILKPPPLGKIINESWIKNCFWKISETEQKNTIGGNIMNEYGKILDTKLVIQ